MDVQPGLRLYCLQTPQDRFCRDEAHLGLYALVRLAIFKGIIHKYMSILGTLVQYSEKGNRKYFGRSIHKYAYKVDIRSIHE